MATAIVSSVSTDAQTPPVPSGPSLSHLWTIGKAARYCNCHPSSLRRHINSNRLPVVRLPNGWFRIDKTNLDKLYNIKSEESEVVITRKPLIYCRVSSQQQKSDGNLERQKVRCVDYCKETYGCDDPYMFLECQGAWNAREILYKAWDLVSTGNVSVWISEYRDRIGRDSSTLRYLERICRKHNTIIDVINQEVDNSSNGIQDSMEELCSYIQHLNAVQYGKRASIKKKINIEEPAMKRAFLLRTQLVSFRIIADILEKEGFVDKNNKPYRYNILAHRLSNANTWASLMALYKSEVKSSNSFEVFCGECVRHAVSKKSVLRRSSLCDAYDKWLDKKENQGEYYPVSYTTISRVMKKMGFTYSTTGKQRKIVTYESISLSTKKRGKAKSAKV